MGTMGIATTVMSGAIMLAVVALYEVLLTLL